MTDVTPPGGPPTEPPAERRPPDVFDRVVGQERAVAHLRAAARAPVHAYLLVGPPGTGRRTAALALAAALLCPEAPGRGCGVCDVCVRVTAGVHPDVAVIEREGAFLGIEQAREIRRLAMRTPNEATRKVLVVPEFHLAQDAVPVLLKVVEEPPPSTVFVILADHVSQELVTIASRCVRIEFGPLPVDRLVEVLVRDGIEPAVAADVAEASGGRLDRARLLASDAGFAARRDAWRAVPSRLDGAGATVAVVAAELVELLGSAAVAPLVARHAREVSDLEERVKLSGERGSGRKVLSDRHRRELRRLRTDELRYGLAVLSAVYRDALVERRVDATAGLAGLDAIQTVAAALIHNPGEPLLLQALLLRLPPVRATAPAATAH
ncbi:MAG: polymerase subunit delta [Actinomycetota bacterium]|nr:polymerase subunit delta [Actinomycetota bacterium]